MFIEIILTTFVILTLVILFKIFYIEQSQYQQYLNLTREFQRLGTQLEHFQQQLGKLNKLVEYLEVNFKNSVKPVPETPVGETIITSISTATTATAPVLSSSAETPLIDVSITSSVPVTPIGSLPSLSPATTGVAEVKTEFTTSTATIDAETLPSPDSIKSALPETETEISTFTLLLKTSQDILKTLWNWIIVGEEHRPKTVSIEYAVATTWLLRFGVLAILFAMGYFLNYSIVKGYFVPWVRIAITLLTGFNMLIVGLHLLRSKYYLIGQGLLGGGLAVLYVSLYAGYFLYQLFTLPTAFASMMFITVTVAFLAIHEDSLLLAILAILGGYTTPLMLWTGPLHLLLLYSYLLLLGLGILVIGHYKQWRLLNYLAFVFNYLLLFGTLWNYQVSDLPVILTFLTLFFILHSSLVYIYNIAKGEKSSLLEITQLLINALIYTAVAYHLIETNYGKSYPAVLSTALATFYAVHAYLFLKYRPVDRNLIISLIALTGFYTTWTMPLTFEQESLSSSWAIQAVLFLWLGLKLRSNFIKNLAYLLYLLIFWRLSFLDIPRYFDLSPQVLSIDHYLTTIWERLWTFGIAIASILGAFSLIHQPLSPFPQWEMDPRNDTLPTVGTRVLENAFYWSGLLFLVLYLHLEFNTLFSHYEPLRLPMLTFIWCGLSMYFLHRYLNTADRVMLVALLVVLTLTLFKIFLLDLPSWQLSLNLVYALSYDTVNVSLRAFDFGMVMVVLYLCWYALKRQPRLGLLPNVLIVTQLLMLFVYLSLEVNSLLSWQFPDFQEAGISILWAVFAIAYLVGGILFSINALRYISLTLFMMVLAKIFLLDLAQTATLYRVLAFLSVGVILVVGSFAYIYSRQKFEKS